MKTALDLVAAAKAGIHEVNVAQAQDAVQQADLPIDVREADEYAQGHLPGAVHMSRGMLEFKLTGNPAYQPRRAVLQDQRPRRTERAVTASHGLSERAVDRWRLRRLGGGGPAGGQAASAELRLIGSPHLPLRYSATAAISSGVILLAMACITALSLVRSRWLNCLSWVSV